MYRLGYNVRRMFENANSFFLSMQLKTNEMSFTNPDAIIEKPIGRIATCEPSAWDFCKNNEYRISMCASVNFEDFKMAHRLLGHVQYYQQYKDQPFLFQQAANPAIFQAIGGVFDLAVSNPIHLSNVSYIYLFTFKIGIYINMYYKFID